jgi:cysteine desulfuration protein SufE
MENPNPYNLPPNLLKRFEQFKKIDDKTKMFERVIALGKRLPAFDLTLKTEENQVKGCVSLTYIAAKLEDAKVYYTGESNSHLVQGLLALLIEGFSGLSPSEILLIDIKFIEDMGLSQTLTASRANGFVNTYNMMQNYAREMLLELSSGEALKS